MAKVDPRIDWDYLEREWRANLKSPGQIAAEYTLTHERGITVPGLYRHFKAKGIGRNLDGRIQERAAQLMQEQLGLLKTESEVIENNAEILASIVFKQRQRIADHTALQEIMLADLIAVSNEGEALNLLAEMIAHGDQGYLEKAIRRVASLPSRIDQSEKLIRNLKTLIDLESAAYRLTNNTNGDAPTTQGDAGPGPASTHITDLIAKLNARAAAAST